MSSSAMQDGASESSLIVHRLNAMDHRLDNMDGRLGSMDERLDRVDATLGGLSVSAETLAGAAAGCGGCTDCVRDVSAETSEGAAFAATALPLSAPPARSSSCSWLRIPDEVCH